MRAIRRKTNQFKYIDVLERSNHVLTKENAELKQRLEEYSKTFHQARKLIDDYCDAVSSLRLSKQQYETEIANLHQLKKEYTAKINGLIGESKK